MREDGAQTGPNPLAGPILTVCCTTRTCQPPLADAIPPPTFTRGPAGPCGRELHGEEDKKSLEELGIQTRDTVLVLKRHPAFECLSLAFGGVGRAQCKNWVDWRPIFFSDLGGVAGGWGLRQGCLQRGFCSVFRQGPIFLGPQNRLPQKTGSPEWSPPSPGSLPRLGSWERVARGWVGGSRPPGPEKVLKRSGPHVLTPDCQQLWWTHFF